MTYEEEEIGIVSWIVLGLIAGALAKFIMPGKDHGGIIVTILIGIAGAFVGGFVGSLAGVGTVGARVGRISAAYSAFRAWDCPRFPFALTQPAIRITLRITYFQAAYMGTRTVRLDERTENRLQRLRRSTGLSISEVLKHGVRAYAEQVATRAETNPYEIYRRLDLGSGGWSVASARDAKRGVREAIARKHRR